MNPVPSAFPFTVPPGIADVEDWLTRHGFQLVAHSGKSVMAAEARYANTDGLAVRLYADRGYWESHIVFPSGFWTHAVTAALLSRDERVSKAWDAYQPRASTATGYLDDLRQAILWIYAGGDPETLLRQEHQRQRELVTPSRPPAPMSDGGAASHASAPPPAPAPAPAGETVVFPTPVFPTPPPPPAPSAPPDGQAPAPAPPFGVPAPQPAPAGGGRRSGGLFRRFRRSG